MVPVKPLQPLKVDRKILFVGAPDTPANNSSGILPVSPEQLENTWENIPQAGAPYNPSNRLDGIAPVKFEQFSKSPVNTGCALYDIVGKNFT